jgi:hypothetical protein
LYFDQTNAQNLEFQENGLLSNNAYIDGGLWGPCYYTIYQANSVIEGLTQYSGVDDSTKTELLGEARFLRALGYFYATNFFGNIPLVLTTNWIVTRTYTNSPSQEIYQQMINDLQYAQQVLPNDFSVANGERTRANKWAAAALLARVYLYQGLWASADSAATAVINAGLFSLVPLSMVPANSAPPSDSDVFAANSQEAILQLQPTTNSVDCTPEGKLFIPGQSSPPNLYLTPSLLNAFEPGDTRRIAWIDSTNYGGTVYYYPFKYFVGVPNQQANVPFPQYYMVLRLGEQFLIRAEAEANGAGNGITAAIQDLNAIRARAGLDSLSSGLSKTQVLQAVAQERRVELFAEWGHRWFDLKRSGNAATVLSTNKGFTVNSDALLYPIPNAEIIDDPNLQQNPGYQQ